MDTKLLLPHQKIDAEIDLEFRNIGSLFQKRTKQSPNKIFLISPGKREDVFSYQDFLNSFLNVARYLSDLGLKKGDRINLIIPTSPEFLLMFFAALTIGITVVPINPDLAPREILYIITDSQSKVAFYDIAFENKIKQISEYIPNNVQSISLNPLPDFEPLLKKSEIHQKKTISTDLNLTDEAVIIYTSGTSGHPKGAVLSHLNLLSDAKAISEWFKFSEQTRTMCILPLFHNNGQVVTLLAPLYGGGTTIIVKGKVSLMSFWGLVHKYRINWSSVMASMLSILLSLPAERRDNTMQGIICGGQVLTESVQDSFEKRFNVPIFEGYGLTETTSFSCFNDFPEDRRRKGSIGKALPINDMTIMDEKGNELGPNVDGEICIRGFNVTKGYLGLSERNKTAFHNGWFHSGDYGYKDEDGYFYFKGRKDALIIKGGENIYPSELENVIFQHPSVAECAVIGIPDRLLGEDIVAYVKLKKGFQTTEVELREFCKGKIAYFKQAKKIIIIDELEDLYEIPKGPTKKILYRKLKEYYLSHELK